MSEYDESFEEFVEEEVESEDGAAMRRSRSRSPSRWSRPPQVEPVAESSYEDESFEAASCSPVKQATAASSTPAKFPCGSAVEVYWPDENEWFAGSVVEYDSAQGYFVRYVDGDEQWEDDKDMRWPQKSVQEPSKDPIPPPPAPLSASTILSPPVLNRILIPRAYTPQAHHPSTIKTARPYTCVATHPIASSTYMTPRHFTRAMEACVECRARCTCMHESVRWANCSLPMPPSLYGQHPSSHRHVQPAVAEQETQTYVCSTGSRLA